VHALAVRTPHLIQSMFLLRMDQVPWGCDFM
jgi:hypothetical protein